MPLCKKCGKTFSVRIKLNEKVRHLGKRKYCLDCSPFGSRNTRKLEITYPEQLKVICKICLRPFIYNKKKNHRKNMCGSCAVIQWRRRTKQKAVDYKGGKCTLCGYSKCLRNLTFHHLNPSEKSFQICCTLGWERIKKELDKCILVCCRCHGEIEEGLIVI